MTSHWRVKSGGEEVFHAYQLNDRREPKNPVFKWDVFEYELVIFKRGSWLDHIEEIYKKATAPPEKSSYFPEECPF